MSYFDYINLNLNTIQNDGDIKHSNIDILQIKKDKKKLATSTIIEILDLYTKYGDLHNKYIYMRTSPMTMDLGAYGFPKTSPYLYLILDPICDYISNLYPKYKEKIIFKETEEANGYKLYDCKMNIFDICDFLLLLEKFDNTKKMPYEEFKNEFEKRACSEWSKMDEHGESFGGFWQSNDPAIRDNAYDLSFENNCKKLYELPYSDKFKLWTVDFGCRNRLESVRYSNFLCNWFYWKKLQMGECIKINRKMAQVEKYKKILEDIAMEPSRITRWYFDSEHVKNIKFVFNKSIDKLDEKIPLREIIKQVEIINSAIY